MSLDGAGPPTPLYVASSEWAAPLVVMVCETMVRSPPAQAKTPFAAGPEVEIDPLFMVAEPLLACA